MHIVKIKIDIYTSNLIRYAKCKLTILKKMHSDAKASISEMKYLAGNRHVTV